MTLDIQLLYFLNGLAGKSEIIDDVIVFLASYLAYLFIIAFILFLYFSRYSIKEKLIIFLTTFSSAIITRFGIAEIIRFFYHRPRPFLVHNLHPLLSSNSWSFPSGHAIFFFAMATAIYLYNKKWGLGFFFAALLITTARVTAGVHYPSDILGGMIIGTITAYMIFLLSKKVNK